MQNPRAERENFPSEDPRLPYAGIAREGVNDPNELAAREELPYDDRAGIGIVGVFLGALLLLALSIFFFGSSPKGPGVATSDNTQVQRPVTGSPPQ